jgi:hypothetical protein
VAQVQLRLNRRRAEVFVRLKRPDTTYEILTATVDTGAQISLFPRTLLLKAAYRKVNEGVISIEQAGIASQSFKAIEAIVTLFLEDQYGNQTRDIEVLAWFADTRIALLGFTDVLDRAVLHLDMVNQPSGYIDIPD